MLVDYIFMYLIAIISTPYRFDGDLGGSRIWGVRFTPNSFLIQLPPDGGYVRVTMGLG